MILKSQKPKAKSQKPKAKSQKPKAKSQKPKASIAWPYDAIFAEWGKLTQAIQDAAHRHWPQASREDVEDAIMHAVELLEKKKPPFQSIAPAYVWLFQCVDHYLYHRHRTVENVEGLETLNGFAVEDLLICTFEIQDELDNAIRALCDEDKELLYFNDIAGFTLREIAEWRDVSLDSIKVRKSRAMKQIRRK